MTQQSPRQPGRFIVIEGLEGAGKTTAMQVVQGVLQQHGINDWLTTREPGGTPLAEQLRTLVKQAHDEQVTPETELLLMYASRSQLVANRIKPALAAGQWVLGDRHDWSSQAYQGGGRQLPAAMLNTLRDLVLGDFRPDLTLYLDIEPQRGLQRARQRGELDRIEQEDIDFFQRTRACYLRLAEKEPHAHVIDANQSLAAVSAQVTQVLNTTLQQWGL